MKITKNTENAKHKMQTKNIINLIGKTTEKEKCVLCVTYT